jgi:hypothetical protein
MKHITLFENYSSHLFEEEDNRLTQTAEMIQEYIKKNPQGKIVAKSCLELFKAMDGLGTDEDAIYSVFTKIKSKEELVQLIAIWDVVGGDYDKSDITEIFKSVGNFFAGRGDAYAKEISNRWNMFSLGMKDFYKGMLGTLTGDKQKYTEYGTKGKDAGPLVTGYLKAREDFFKKYPAKKSTSLSYWLREELDEEALAKVNGIIKKFGVQF